MLVLFTGGWARREQEEEGRGRKMEEGKLTSCVETGGVLVGEAVGET